MNKETTSVLDAFLELRERLKQDILGQHMLVERLLLALLADGHLLVEGAPGLAKTRAVKMLGETIEGDFHRIQFSPVLVGWDVWGWVFFGGVVDLYNRPLLAQPPTWRSVLKIKK